MRHFLIIITVFFLAKYSNAQQLDFTLLEKLTTISLEESDSFMVNYYGFEKVENKSDNNQSTYAKYSNHDLDNTVIITILFLENEKNDLEVSLGKNFKVENISNKLTEKGFKKQSVIDFKFSRYKKEQLIYYVSQIPNENGQINVKITSES